MISYFTANVLEIKYEYNNYYKMYPFKGWNLHESELGVCHKPGLPRLKRLYRVKENVVFHEEDLNITFKEGLKVNINDEVVKIINVVYNLDESITYHTDKIINQIEVNTIDDAKAEFTEQIQKFCDAVSEEVAAKQHERKDNSIVGRVQRWIKIK